MKTISRARVQAGLASLLGDSDALAAVIGGAAARTSLAAEAVAPAGGTPVPELPESVRTWLGRLKLLYGVPIQYLVPDEGMLPPESIRFFYLDANWIDSLVDGAFSIGRTLSTEEDAASLTLDRAAAPTVDAGAADASAEVRADALGVETPHVSFQTVTGFLLRSTLVGDYPGLGVNAYPEGGTPTDENVVLLDIVRMERLGPNADTLICLIAGDPVRIDVHEAPESLHYGIDRFGGGEATKTIRRFTRESDGSVTMHEDQLVRLDLEAGGAFRSGAPRTMKMATVASMIAAAQEPPLPSIDSAIMGFEMTEGVGNVSFVRGLGGGS